MSVPLRICTGKGLWVKDSVKSRKESEDSFRDWSKDEKVAWRIIEETIALHSPSLTQNMDLYIQEIQETLGWLKRYRIPNIQQNKNGQI